MVYNAQPFTQDTRSILIKLSLIIQLYHFILYLLIVQYGVYMVIFLVYFPSMGRWSILSFSYTPYPYLSLRLNLISSPNLSGAVVGFLCTFIYQRYSPTKDLFMYLIGSIVIIATMIAAYHNQPSIVGGIGSILSVAVMGAPLSVVTTVLRERSTDSLPFASR